MMYDRFIMKPETIFEKTVIKTTLASLYAKYNSVRLITIFEIIDMAKEIKDHERLLLALYELASQITRQSSETTASVLHSQEQS